MRILFCDDNKDFLRSLSQDVSAYFKQIKTKMPDFVFYTSGDDLIAAINTKCETADIAFLDVEMPGQSGIIAGEYLKKQNPRVKILIVTSFPDYLDDAMRFHVFRYLSKPVDKNRLFRNLKDAIYQYNIDTKPVPIETEDGVVVLPADEIICVELVGRKTLIYTSKSILTSPYNMNYWLQNLNLPCFYPSYRDYIINMRYVTSFGKDTITLMYQNQTKIAYLAKRRYPDFKKTFLLYLESMK